MSEIDMQNVEFEEHGGRDGKDCDKPLNAMLEN